MPITQARMLAIISEAQALRDGWRDFALALSEVVAKRGQPYGLSLAEIATLVERNALPATPALTAERNHFVKQGKRNEKNAKSMALKRGAANVERAT
jgi:hypothetical protein